MYGRRPRLPIDVLLDVPTAREDCASNYESFKDSITENRRLANALLEEEQAKIANQEDPDSWVVYNVGDKVWLYTPHLGKGKSRKFHPRWSGPYVVKKRMLPVNYVLVDERDGEERLVHVSRLKKFIDRVPPQGLPDYVRDDEPVEDESNPVELLESRPSRNVENVLDPAANMVMDVAENTHAEVDVVSPWPDKPTEVVGGVPYYEPERIVAVRWRRKGERKQRQYLVQWKGHEGEDSWEPAYNLRDCTAVLEEFRSRVEERDLR